jgi:hypothetical protein
MAILLLHGVQQNVSLGSDTPPKRDVLPLYPKARQVKQRCYARVTASHEWSIACDPFGKRAHPHTFVKNIGGPDLLQLKQQTMLGHAIHLVQ